MVGYLSFISKYNRLSLLHILHVYARLVYWLRKLKSFKNHELLSFIFKGSNVLRMDIIIIMDFIICNCNKSTLQSYIAQNYYKIKETQL